MASEWSSLYRIDKSDRKKCSGKFHHTFQRSVVGSILKQPATRQMLVSKIIGTIVLAMGHVPLYSVSTISFRQSGCVN